MTLLVAAAIIVENGRVLLTQRKKGSHLEGMWEFPGGKVEETEDPRDALARELREELGIETDVGDIVEVTFHAYETKSVLLLFFRATRRTGSPEPRAIDVAAFDWADPKALDPAKSARRRGRPSQGEDVRVSGGSPFRDVAMSPAEVRRVLERAAKIAERDPETAKVERAMTRAEPRSPWPISASRRARSPARSITPTKKARSRKTRKARGSRGKTRVVLERELPGEPSQAQREDLIDEIRDVTGDVGTIESLGSTLVWHATTRRNMSRTLSVRMRFREGRTRLVIEENLLGQAVGLFVGLGVGGGIGPMGGYIALIAKIGVLGLVVRQHT